VATVRYLVTDVERSIAFYTKALGFKLDQSMAPAFARVSNNDLTLWLAGPQSSAARPMPDGRRPDPGGWNRFVVEVDNLESRVEQMKRAGLRFRNEVVTGTWRQADFARGPGWQCCGTIRGCAIAQDVVRGWSRNVPPQHAAAADR
jgi:catechol 2,3-dioxygenase-like lactoylglutathione lyase family enzyme